MKNPGKVVWLSSVTFIFVIFGFSLVYMTVDGFLNNKSCSFNDSSFKNGVEVPNYEIGKVCRCSNGKISCEELAGNKSTEANRYVQTNLKFSAKYSTSQNNNLDVLPLKTKFLTISILENSVEVVLEQEQLCSNDKRAPIQVGSYYFDNSNLVLTNNVNKSPTIYSTPCVVGLTYYISKLSLRNYSDLRISYVNENGATLPATLCYYNSRVFSTGDVYSSKDNCNICKCENGISKCGQDRVCTNSN